jgi:N-acetyl-gamma-glutamyl-phosphate reductase
MMGLKVGIVGVTGYVGVELARILGQHPEVTALYGASKDFSEAALDQVYPHLRGRLALKIIKYEELQTVIDSCDLIFTALPHGLSAPVVKSALAAGKKAIDMAADFRLPDANLYEQWYEKPHGAPELLAEAVYGLPELFRQEIAPAHLVANPGCYPTSALLALAPLLKGGLIECNSVIIDSKSGVSGAGRTPSVGNLFSECNEVVKPYGVGTHRHTPEISWYASVLAGSAVDVVFTPHLVPMTRGMLSTVYSKLRQPLNTDDLRRVYENFYAGESFIQVCRQGEWPQTNWVRGTNNCCLGVAVTGGGQVITVSAIDNLVKGAAGQAVQNMNLIYGFPEMSGLDVTGLYL